MCIPDCFFFFYKVKEFGGMILLYFFSAMISCPPTRGSMSLWFITTAIKSQLLNKISPQLFVYELIYHSLFSSFKNYF